MSCKPISAKRKKLIDEIKKLANEAVPWDIAEAAKTKHILEEQPRMRVVIRNNSIDLITENESILVFSNYDDEELEEILEKLRE